MINTFIQPKEKKSSINSIPSFYSKSKKNISSNSINEKESNGFSSLNILFSSTYGQNGVKTISTLSEIESLSENISILI